MAREILTKDGWVEGKASPEHLPEDLRALPSELVTKDIADEHRVHELDAPHIKEALVKEAMAAENPAPEGLDEATKRLCHIPVGENVPVSRERVDLVRMRILKVLIDNAAQEGRIPTEHQYVWFPQNNVNIYELRTGNPPPDKQRPKYLRGLELHLDIFDWPKTVRANLERLGHKVPDKTGLINECLKSASILRPC